jgi:hypothetical protein
MRALVLVALAACGGSSSDKDGVIVKLASVTLGSDCGDNGSMPPPVEPPPEAREERREAANMAASSEAYPGAAPTNYCSQTAIQFAFSADHNTPVRVKVVELLDGKGKYLQDLATRRPSKWDGSKYVAWDEKLAPKSPVSASYALASPDWEKLGGWSKVEGKTFNVHVVVLIGDTQHSLEKQFVVPVHRTPDVVTMR